MKTHFLFCLLGLAASAGLIASPVEGSDSVRKKLVEMAGDSDARVRFQLAFTLGELSGPDKVDALTRIALKDAGDRWVRAALLSSVTDEADDFFAAYTEALGASPAAGSDDLLRELARVIGARGEKEEIAAAIQATGRLDVERQAGLVASSLAGLRAGLELGGGAGFAVPEAAAALTPLLDAENEAVRAAAFEIAGRVMPAGSPELESMIEESLETALDPDADETRRAEAIGLLRLGSPDKVQQPLTDLVSALEPEQVELAALRSLQSAAGDGFPAIVLGRWPDLGPAAKLAALDVLLSRKAGTEALLAAFESGALTPGLLDAQRQTQLLNHPDAAVAARAEALYSAPSKEEDPALYAQYAAAVELEGDAARGAKWHEERCAQCHQVGQVGRALGPDWASVRANSKESLLISMLYPNRVVAPGYTQYVIETVDGDLFSGLLAVSGPTSILIRTAGGEDITILRRNIDTIRDTSLSMMPAKLEENMTPQDMADLLEFMKNPPEGSHP